MEMGMDMFMLILVLAAVLACGGSAAAYTMVCLPFEGMQASGTESPFSGTWVANIAKSKGHPNHLFHSATMRFVVVGNTVTITHEGVNAGGQQESGTTVVEADGNEHPLPEQSGMAVLAKWMGPMRLEILGKSAGSIVGEASYEVAADGMTLVAEVSGTDASGAHFEQVIVFDRE